MIVHKDKKHSISGSYFDNGVEYLPCIGKPKSIKTRKNGRRVPLSIINRPTVINNWSIINSRNKKTRGDDLNTSIKNAIRILGFKYASQNQKDIAKRFLTGAGERVSRFKIKEICLNLSKYNKDF